MSRPLLAALCLLLAGTPLLADPLPWPEEHLGFRPGTDGRLAGWARLLRYYRALAAASPRVRLLPLGRTVEGREMIALAISSAEAARNLEPHRRRLARLADPRGLSLDDEAALVERSRMAVLISCNLHSNETASSLTAALLAHELAASESALVRRIRRELVVLLVPSLNPDGTDAVARWYARVKGTPFEGSAMPYLYHRYAGHDNNRDWYMLTQPETRHVTRLLYREWFPQLVLDLHEMGERGARFFVPPFVDPVDPHVDPMLLRSIDLFGNQLALDLARAGKTGVVQGVVFDSWWNGGMRNTPWRHNVIGLLTEAARVRYASPIHLPRETLRGHGRGLPRYERRYAFPEPWPGGWWRIGDIIEYQRIASLSLLELAATLRRKLLANYVLLGRRAVARGLFSAPFAYVLPARQHDPAAARRLLETLAGGGVELHRAVRPFTAGGRRYAAGSHVIRLAQPYRAHVMSLLERQAYPELKSEPGGRPIRPYDIAGWTLPLMLGVDCRAVAAPFEAQLERIARPADPPAPGPRLPCRDSGSYAAVNRLLAAGRAVARLPDGDFHAGPEAPPGSRRLVAPRLAVYRPHVASMDEGWTRWVLDQAAFRYRSLDNAAIRAGRLAASFDVLILPDLTPRTLEHGATDPLPPPYAGGLGRAGLDALRRFVTEGGTLVCLNRSCLAAIELFALKLRNVIDKQAKKRFACPGSILRVELDTQSALGLGGQTDSALVFARSPAFEAREGQVVARYPATGDALLSGYLRGGELLRGKAAVVVVQRGKGRVVLFGCRPQFRGQPTRTFRWLYNAIWLCRR